MASIDWPALLGPWMEIIRRRIRLCRDVHSPAAIGATGPFDDDDDDGAASWCLEWSPPLSLLAPADTLAAARGADTRRRHLEALELLDLCGRVDPSAVGTILGCDVVARDLANGERNRRQTHATDTRAPISITVRIAPGIMADLHGYRVVMEAAIVYTSRPPTLAFEATVACIQDEWRRQQQHHQHGRVPEVASFTRTLETRIPMCLDLREANSYRDIGCDVPQWLDSGGLAAIQRSVDEFLKEKQREQVDPHLTIEMAPFVLDSYAINMRPYPTTRRFLEQIQAILRQGLGLVDLTCGSMRFEAEDPAFIAKVLRSMVNPTSYDCWSTTGAAHESAHSLDTTSRGVRSLTFGEPADAVAWESLCSAIIDSHCLRHLGVRDQRARATTEQFNDEQLFDIHDARGALPPLPSVWRWRWLAFALFSSEARHRLTSVALELSTLGGEEVEAIREIVCSPYPSCHLSGAEKLEPIPVTSQTLAKFKPGAVVLRYLELRSVPTTVSIDPAHWHRILCNDPQEDEIIILSPGVGRCAVRRSQIHEIRIATAPQTRPRMSKLELGISLVAGGLCAAASLLELIGGPVEHLILSARQRESQFHVVDKDFLSRACAACPKLQTLEFRRICLSSFQIVASVYAEGLCRARSLVVANVDVQDEESTLELILALGNRGHEITRWLRSFVWLLHHLILLDAPYMAMLIDECDEMLKSNRRLARIIVETGSEDARRQLQAMMTKHDGVAIAIRSGPLALRSKLAMLSVMRSRENANSTTRASAHLWIQVARPLPRLPRDPLTLVFQFAACHGTRCCLATYHQ